MTESAGRKVIAQNRKARHEYEILETFEAGLVLKGPEVKSVRDRKVAFQDSFARIDRGEAWLYNFHIQPYEPANRWNERADRPRKLLLKRQELRRLIGKVEEKGLSLIPLDLYFVRGVAKITLALGRGKKLHDKRDKMKRDTMEREARRAMKVRS